MMRFYSILFFLVMTSLFLSGCSETNAEKSNPFEEQKVLFDEVMEIHDEVMPEMQTIYDLKKQLDTKLTQMGQESSTLDSTTFVRTVQHKRALEEADDAMMSWMRDFADKMAPPKEDKYKKYLEKEGMTHEAYLQFLQAEKSKVEVVKEKMNSSIENAKQFLSK